MLNTCCSGARGARRSYLSGARCFFSQLRSSSAGLVSALGLVPCRSESPPRNSQVSRLLLCPLASRPSPGVPSCWPQQPPDGSGVRLLRARTRQRGLAAPCPAGFPPRLLSWASSPYSTPSCTSSAHGGPSCPNPSCGSFEDSLQPPPPRSSQDPLPRPPALTGVTEKDALGALAPVGGHGELHPQRLAGRRGVVDGGVHHLVDGVQQAGDVLGGGSTNRTWLQPRGIPGRRQGPGEARNAETLGLRKPSPRPKRRRKGTTGRGPRMQA